MLAFVSVLYFPDINALSNIDSAQRAGLTSIVYLNKVSDVLKRELLEKGVVVLGENNNVGLGPALHEIEAYLLEKGFEAFIYFDQDTVVDPVLWNEIEHGYKTHFIGTNNGLLFYTSQKKEIQKFPDVVINSGSLFSLDAIAKVGGHSESYFVECVDYEFCSRLKARGYDIETIYVDGIDHVSLQDGEWRYVFGKNRNIRTYSLSRCIDFNISHVKLFFVATLRLQKRLVLLLLKSLLMFNVRQVSNSILKRL